jgi:hypothetical protein
VIEKDVVTENSQPSDVLLWKGKLWTCMKENTKQAMTERKYVNTAALSAVVLSEPANLPCEVKRYRKVKALKKAAAPRMCDQMLTVSLWTRKVLLRERT